MKERIYCADPFKKHKSKILRGVQGATSALEASVNDARITKGTPLCVSCRTALKNDPSSLPLLEENPLSSSQSSEETSIASSVKGPTEVSTSSSNQTVVEQVTEMEASQVVTEVLDSLEETPVRSSKFFYNYVLIVLYMSRLIRYCPDQWCGVCVGVGVARSRGNKSVVGVGVGVDQATSTPIPDHLLQVGTVRAGKKYFFR